MLQFSVITKQQHLKSFNATNFILNTQQYRSPSWRNDAHKWPKSKTSISVVQTYLISVLWCTFLSKTIYKMKAHSIWLNAPANIQEKINHHIHKSHCLISASYLSTVFMQMAFCCLREPVTNKRQIHLNYSKTLKPRASKAQKIGWLWNTWNPHP